MKEIKLTQGKVALVDDDTHERLNQFKWCARRTKNLFYAQRHSLTINGIRSLIHMHHEVIGVPPIGLMTDHINGNGTDNRLENLRHVTCRQNNQNQRNVKTTSQYPGVYWHKNKNKWHAQITINRKCKYLGLFIKEEDAFEAYQNAVNALGETVIGEI